MAKTSSVSWRTLRTQLFLAKPKDAVSLRPLPATLPVDGDGPVDACCDRMRMSNATFSGRIVAVKAAAGPKPVRLHASS